MALIEQRLSQEELEEELRRMLRGWQDDLLATNPNFFPKGGRTARRYKASKKEIWKRKIRAYDQIKEIIKTYFYAEILEPKEGQIFEGWIPTARNISALPEPLRKYIHDLETNRDPARMVRESKLSFIPRQEQNPLEQEQAGKELLSILTQWRVLLNQIANPLIETKPIEDRIFDQIEGIVKIYYHPIGSMTRHEGSGEREEWIRIK